MVCITRRPSAAYGTVKQFIGRLERQIQHINSAEDLTKILHRYVWLDNQNLPQKATSHQTPLIALKRWQDSHPHLFTKRVINHLGPNNHQGVKRCADYFLHSLVW
jgi:hypothetical protein